MRASVRCVRQGAHHIHGAQAEWQIGFIILLNKSLDSLYYGIDIHVWLVHMHILLACAGSEFRIQQVAKFFIPKR